MLKSFPHYHQLDAMDCGPTCLRMIAKHYGRSYTLSFLRERSFITREGVSMLGISDAGESIGFRTSGVCITVEQLKKETALPCILHWNQSHFVVLYKAKRGRFYIADPASQKVVFNEDEFKRCWLSTKSEGEDTGTALLLEPGPEILFNPRTPRQIERIQNELAALQEIIKKKDTAAMKEYLTKVRKNIE